MPEAICRRCGQKIEQRDGKWVHKEGGNVRATVTRHTGSTYAERMKTEPR